MLLTFCLQVAAGLQYLTERHIHHTDLKAADNILIDNKYTVKITGFHAAVRKPGNSILNDNDNDCLANYYQNNRTKGNGLRC